MTAKRVAKLPPTDEPPAKAARLEVASNDKDQAWVTVSLALGVHEGLPNSLPTFLVTFSQNSLDLNQARHFAEDPDLVQLVKKCIQICNFDPLRHKS